MEEKKKGQEISDAAHEAGKVYAREYGEKMRAQGEKAESERKLKAASAAYLMAGLAGDPEGVYGYAKSLFWGWNGEPDYRMAHAVFSLLRNMGYKKEACYFLAAYEEQGVLREKNYEKAIALYTEGAEDGDFRCHRRLGEIYAEGELTEEDPAKSYYNYMMAGAIGDPVSVTNMAMFLEEGYGCEKNLDRAVELYRMAADAGEENAAEALARLGVK